MLAPQSNLRRLAAQGLLSLLCSAAIGILASSPVAAQGWFFAAPAPVSTDLTDARTVRIADLDSDGDLDVIATAESSEVAWFANDGSAGAFARYPITSSDGNGRGVDIGDVDGDGDMDVVVAKTTDNAVYLYRRASLDPSVLWTKSTVASLNGATDVRFTDTDDDGDLDVVATGAVADRVLIATNTNGDASAWSTLASIIVDGAARIEPVDINLDGDMDLLVTGNESDNLRQLRFFTVGIYQGTTLASSLDGAWGVAAGDIEPDGDIDVVASANEDGDVIALERTSASGFVQSSVDSSFSGARDLKLVDLDVDGDLDIVGISDAGDLVLWENLNSTASEGAYSWKRWNLGTGLGDAWSFDIGDLDADGDPDLVVARAIDAAAGDPVIWFRNDAPHSRFEFDASTTELVPAAATSVRTLDSMALGDINQDGHLDIVAAGTGSSAELGWWSGVEADDAATFTMIQPTGFSSNVDIEVVDYDDDGDLDVLSVWGHNVTGLFRWWENMDGTGGVWDSHTVGANIDYTNIEVADLFGEGTSRAIVSGGAFGTAIRAFSNSETAELIGDHAASALRVGDMDLDGDLDVVVGGRGPLVPPNPGDAGLVLFAQTPGGWSETTLDQSTALDDIRLIDWDEDGDLDIIGVNTDPGEILWYENPTLPLPPIRGGIPSYTRHDISLLLLPGEADNSYDRVVVGDFDQNGRPELVASSTEVHPTIDLPLLARVESGPGSNVSFELEADPDRLLVAADVNGDGFEELAILDRFNDLVLTKPLAGTVGRFNGTIPATFESLVPRQQETHVITLQIRSFASPMDLPIELRVARLLWDDFPDFPEENTVLMEPHQVRALVESIAVYVDDGDDLFDPLVDMLVFDDYTLDFAGQALEIVLPPGSVAAAPSMFAPRAFVTITLQSLAPTAHFRIRPSPDPLVVSGDFDAPVNRLSFTDLDARFRSEADPTVIFVDGFESGDTGAWAP